MSSSPLHPQQENELILVIKEEEITVAPEGRATIRVAVINKSPVEDYVELLVKGVPSDWTTIDTPVVRVAPGEAKQVTLTVQPPPVPQTRVGRYPLDIRAVSQNDPTRSATVRSFLTVAAYQSRGRIGIMLGSIHFSVSPGSTIHIPILLQNRGEETDSFRLNVEGIPPNWLSTNSAVTKLDPASSKEILLTIRVPLASEATAGRTPIRIVFNSETFPDQSAQVECILTISAFMKFSAALQPERLESGQAGRVTIENQGNIADTYTLDFESSGGALVFEKGVPVPKRGAQAGTEQVEIAFVEIPRDEKFQISAGGRGIYTFHSRLRSRPIIGNEQSYPYSVTVHSTDNKSVDLAGMVTARGYIPVWLASSVVIGAVILCLAVLIPFGGIRNSASATQTAIFNQTQAALAGKDDTDGDGLINEQEIALGIDPFKADSDEDGLFDGEEVNNYQTNPLSPDTDQDGLRDGEEIKNYQTDPRNPDTDADLLNDGDEIKNRTDPRNPDTDQDGVGDGAEITIGTNPLDQDTDKDLLRDGQENQTCPRPLAPDSDNDGIIDGNDLDPCNPANPSLTATALAGVTLTPTLPVITPTATPTIPSVITLTAPPPSLQGIMVYSSNREGNFEIYATNLTNQATSRLTSNPALDMQPALAPDSVQVAYVSNQDGNNEIYLTGIDGRTPINLTNNAADDQQPTWSPDGNWIAFTSNRDGNQEIYVMRSNGTELRNISNNGANDFAPAWFSVGGLFGNVDWIAFTSTRDGNQEIYKVRPDGSQLANLTQNPANDFSPSGFPGGSVLAFVTDRDGNPEIYVMTDTGGGLVRITNSTAQDLDPVLNSNGQWIAFSTDRDGNLEIYVVRSTGGAASNLTRNPGQDRHPDW